MEHSDVVYAETPKLLFVKKKNGQIQLPIGTSRLCSSACHSSTRNISLHSNTCISFLSAMTDFYGPSCCSSLRYNKENREEKKNISPFNNPLPAPPLPAVTLDSPDVVKRRSERTIHDTQSGQRPDVDAPNCRFPQCSSERHGCDGYCWTFHVAKATTQNFSERAKSRVRGS